MTCSRSNRTLYPALHRLLKRGWITYAEGASENNRRANFYSLTAKGRKQLDIETSKWDRLATAIARVPGRRRRSDRDVFRRWRALARLDADIRDHLEREIQDNVDRGMTPEEARRRA